MSKRGGRRGRGRSRERQKSSKVERAMADVATLIFGDGGVPPSFPLDSYFDGLRASVWLMACSYRLAFTIASVPFKVLRRKDKTEATGRKAALLRDLFERVNPEDTYFDWTSQRMLHLAVAGETFTEIADNRLGEPAELYEWNPDSVYPIPDKTGRRRVSRFRFTTLGSTIELDRRSVIHTKVYNPFARHRGFSFVSPMRTDLSSDVQAAQWNRAFLRNGARSGGWLKPTMGDLSDDQWRRLVSEVKRTTAGAANAGKFGVLPTGIDVVETGSSPKEADWLNLRKWVREVAAGSTGIPPILVGNFDAASYANTEQQLRAFWDYVGKPWLVMMFSAMNEGLVHPRIDQDLLIWPDMLAIDSLIDSESTRVDNTTKLVGAGVMTINEGRQRQGLPSLPDGDRLLLPLALDPVTGDDLERSDDASSSDDSTDSSNDDEPDDDGDKMKATPREREAMRSAYLTDVEAATQKIKGAATRFLKDLRIGFVERARSSGSILDPDTISGPIELEARSAFEKLGPVFLEVVQDGADATMRRLGFEKGIRIYRRKIDAPQRLPELIDIVGAFDELNPRVLAFLEVAFGHLEDLTRSAVDQVRSTVAEGLRDGLGINEIVLRLESLGVFSESRAESIARTETAAALNLGANEAFRLAGTDRKSWLSAKIEGRTRDSHREADDRYSRAPIPVDEKFVLEDPGRNPSTAELMFPSDPEAPGWATINCLCSMVPEQPEQRRYWVARCLEEIQLCPQS